MKKIDHQHFRRPAMLLQQEVSVVVARRLLEVVPIEWRLVQPRIAYTDIEDLHLSAKHLGHSVKQPIATSSRLPVDPATASAGIFWPAIGAGEGRGRRMRTCPRAQLLLRHSTIPYGVGVAV